MQLFSLKKQQQKKNTSKTEIYKNKLENSHQIC